MKKHLKSTLLMSVSVLGVASIAGYSVLSNAGQRATDTMQVSQAMEITDNQSAIVAQASNNNRLASQLQGKPTIVKIYADWCPACQRLRPVTESLQQQFKGRANFVVFDVTSRSTTQAAEARARELGLGDFLAAHRSQTSTVAVINPSNGQILTQFRYNFNQQDYVNGIERAIERVSARS
ncbi:MAG: thioredoxin domain-containing protein [Leptolyngbya sp. Prado105]|jgi:thiol-disulfide isomerase/thioredoxin|nr:thioredoxin domain-containing protein [Leptolyngbya sp. Prado105]